MFLRSLRSVLQPEIRTEKDLRAYVVGVTLLCGALAVTLDVINQLTFFIDWETTIRSWTISLIVGCGIAAPVSFAIARAHLELFRAKPVVEELSRRDPLTGLLNRRALLEPVDGAMPEVMALVIADIDRFKAVNDTHGHLVGDEVIKMVARAMQESLGAYGQIGRIGGEEFALISPGPASTELIETLWDFRDRVGSTAIVLGSTSVRVTISIGVATRKDGQSLDELFADADRALYLAKASGRNRVVEASELTTQSPNMAEDEARAVERRRIRSAT